MMETDGESWLAARLRVVLAVLVAIRHSLADFAVTFALSLFTFGGAWIWLHDLVAPLLPADRRSLGDFTTDSTVGASMIVIGLAWPLGFVLAGLFDVALARRARSVWLRWLVYLAVLWVWAVLLWWCVPAYFEATTSPRTN